jgi:alpha-L-fucosidase
VTLVATGAKLTFTQKPDGLHIQVPAEAPGKYAYVYRIQFAGAR